MTWRAVSEGIAAAQNKSIQHWLERLRSLVESSLEHRTGSTAAVLRAMQEPPHLIDSDVDELDAAIAGGRLPVQTGSLLGLIQSVIFRVDHRLVICTIIRGEVLLAWEGSLRD